MTPDAVQSRFNRTQATVLLCVFLGLAVSYPAVYASTFSVFFSSVKGSYGWSNLHVGLGTSIATAGMASGSLLLSRFANPANLRRFMRTGFAGFSASLIMLGVGPASLPFYLAVSFCVGVFGSFTSAGTFMSVLPLWFEKNLGKGIAFVMMGMSGGIIVVPLFARYLIQTVQWAPAYVILGVLSLIIGMAVTFVLPKAHEASQLPLAAGDPVVTASITVGRDRTFWLLATCFFMISACGFGLAAHALPLYSSLSASTHPAVVIVALGVGTLVGRVGLGLILDIVFAPYAGAVVFVIASVAAAAFAGSWLGGHSDLAPLLVFCFGLGFGAEWDLMAYLTRRYFPPAHYAQYYNRLLMLNYAGGICGPILVASVVDQSGTYRPVLYFFAAVYLGAAALMACLGAYRFDSANSAHQH